MGKNLEKNQLHLPVTVFLGSLTGQQAYFPPVLARKHVMFRVWWWLFFTLVHWCGSIHWHWPVIKNDRILGPLLPNNPRVLFRGAMSLRHTLAPNVPDPPQRPTFFGDLKGFSPCRRCRVCRVNALRQRRLTEFTSVGTGVTYPINSLITCTSKCVVYLLRCPCGLEYVGWTTRKQCKVRGAYHQYQTRVR